MKKMKKLLVLCTMFLLLVSCNKYGKIEIDKNNSYYSTVLKIGNLVKSDDVEEVKFIIPASFKDSLKLSNETILDMCETSLRYSDWGAKNKLTYKLTDDRVSFFINKNNTISAIVGGSAQNSYGVPGTINTVIYFDIKGKQLSDKDDIPIIDAF